MAMTAPLQSVGERDGQPSGRSVEVHLEGPVDLTLLMIGILCLVAAVVGGSLKLAGAEFPPLRPRRQLLLTLVGLVAAAAGVVFIVLPDLGTPSSTSTTTGNPTADSPRVMAPRVMAEPNQGAPGSTFSVSGSGFAPHEAVRFAFAAGSASASGSCSASDCSSSSHSSGNAAGSSTGSCSGSGCAGSSSARTCNVSPIKDIQADGKGAFRGELVVPQHMDDPQRIDLDLTCVLEGEGITSRLEADTPFGVVLK